MIGRIRKWSGGSCSWRSSRHQSEWWSRQGLAPCSEQKEGRVGLPRARTRDKVCGSRCHVGFPLVSVCRDTITVIVYKITSSVDNSMRIYQTTSPERFLGKRLPICPRAPRRIQTCLPTQDANSCGNSPLLELLAQRTSSSAVSQTRKHPQSVPAMSRTFI